MGEICTVLDQMEHQVLEYAIKEDKAVLGICRGIQYLNAMLGGSLYQDLNVQHPSKTKHHMEPPYDRVIHQVQIIDGSSASSVVAGNRTWCEQLSSSGSKNSCAIADCDGRIRRRTGGSCLYAEKNLCVAVQWHPELSYQTDNTVGRYLKALWQHVNNMKERRKKMAELKA